MGKRIVFVGTGALRGYTGAHLTRAGHDVTLIDAWPEHVERLRSHGLEVSGLTPEERHVVRVDAMHVNDVQSLCRRRPVDIAFMPSQRQKAGRRRAVRPEAEIIDMRSAAIIATSAALRVTPHRDRPAHTEGLSADLRRLYASPCCRTVTTRPAERAGRARPAHRATGSCRRVARGGGSSDSPCRFRSCRSVGAQEG